MSQLIGQLIRARVDDFCRQKRLHANSLVISMFGDVVAPRGGRIWLGSLIRLLEPVGLGGARIRTAVFRLARDEWLGSEAFGRRSDVLLTRSGQTRFEEASRHVYAPLAPVWDRRWRLILGVAQLGQKDRDALRRVLYWQGFGVLRCDCFVHPSADLSAAFDALLAEGLGHLLDGLMPMLATDVSLSGAASNADLVARAWNLDQLATAYERFVATYMPSLLEIQGERNALIDEEEAFLMRLLLIHDYRRLLLRDPELPEMLLPDGWPGQVARLLCKTLYRALLAPSERHLDLCFSTADGSRPSLIPSFCERFSEDDERADLAS